MKISDDFTWPAITKTPRAPLAATIARLLFTRAIGNLGLTPTWRIYSLHLPHDYQCWYQKHSNV